MSKKKLLSFLAVCAVLLSGAVAQAQTCTQPDMCTGNQASQWNGSKFVCATFTPEPPTCPSGRALVWSTNKFVCKDLKVTVQSTNTWQQCKTTPCVCAAGEAIIGFDGHNTDSNKGAIMCGKLDVKIQ